MKRFLKIAAFAALAGCATGHYDLFATPPSQWTDTQIETATYGENSFFAACLLYQIGASGQKDLTKNDFAVLDKILLKRGLNRRDLEIMSDPEAGFGTGQSYTGLQCKNSGQVRVVNRSFYPGTGHEWQAQLGDSFIYLRGDTTEDGMIVFAWN